MDLQNISTSRAQQSLLATHTVLRNTYMLLSMTLLFSAACALYSMQSNIHISFVFSIAGMFGLLFLTQALRNSAWGILSAFAFTGFMGLTLGPMLNYYLQSVPNGDKLISTSLGATGIIFLTLSAYVLTTKKDFSFMGGFLFATMTVAFLVGIASVFFNMPLLQVAISGAFVLLASGYILYTTSMIINNGESNYILATISLYVAIFNLFVNLLSILKFLSGNRD